MTEWFLLSINYKKSGQVSRGSTGEYQADERAGVARLSCDYQADEQADVDWSAGEYHADEQAGVAGLSWRVSGR